MKKHILLLIAFAFASAIAFASGGEKGEKVIVKIEKGDPPKTLDLRLANLEKMNTEIAIQSVAGYVWFSKYVRREIGYATRLNMNGMPDGDYVLFVRNKHSLWSQAFTIGGAGIALFEMPEAQPVKEPLASPASYNTAEKGKLITHFTKEGRLSLGVQLANLQNQPATIRIVMRDGGSIFTQRVAGKTGYAHPLNLKRFSPGDYFLYVQAGDATVVQFFTISKRDDLSLGTLQRLERPMPVNVPDGKITGK